MSKKSERNAQIQKVRSAQPLQSQRRTESLSPAGGDQQPRLRKSRKALPRWLFWTLVVVLPLVGLSCLSGLVSAILPPAVTPPLPFLAALAPSIEISNQSFLPLKSVEYTCALATVTDQSGFSVNDPSGGIGQKHSAPSLARGEKVPLDCEGHLDPQGLRIRSAESRVTISYFHPGWPFRRHTEYLVHGEFDPRGNLMRWRII